MTNNLDMHDLKEQASMPSLSFPRKISLDMNSNLVMSDDGDFTAEQMAQFYEVFNWFDSDNDNFLNKIEVGNAMRALGENPTNKELNTLMYNIDGNISDKINFSKFLIMIAHKMQTHFDEEHINNIFKIFCDTDNSSLSTSNNNNNINNNNNNNNNSNNNDSNNNKFISKQKLITYMTKMGEPLDIKDVSKLLNNADKNNDNKIDYNEFMHFLLKFD